MGSGEDRPLTPRQALELLQEDAVSLYSGGHGDARADEAWAALDALVRECEKASGRREVWVRAVVEVEETEGPQDQGAAYRAVAGMLMRVAQRRLDGVTDGLVAMERPVIEFEARSERRRAR